MGNWWSKVNVSSVDVSGNNNQVLIIKDVHYDWSLLLHQLKQVISRQHQTTMIVLVTGLILVLLVTVAFHLLKMQRQEQCRSTIAHLQSDIASLHRRFNGADHPFTSTVVFSV
jgi:hypothetical protein